MHKILFTKSAQKELAALPQQFQTQIAERIKGLRENPFPQGVVKLQGTKDGFRVRSGDYRILYTIENNTVAIFAIGNRKDVYR